MSGVPPTRRKIGLTQANHLVPIVSVDAVADGVVTGSAVHLAAGDTDLVEDSPGDFHRLPVGVSGAVLVTHSEVDLAALLVAEHVHLREEDFHTCDDLPPFDWEFPLIPSVDEVNNVRAPNIVAEQELKELVSALKCTTHCKINEVKPIEDVDINNRDGVGPVRTLTARSLPDPRPPLRRSTHVEGR